MVYLYQTKFTTYHVVRWNGHNVKEIQDFLQGTQKKVTVSVYKKPNHLRKRVILSSPTHDLFMQAHGKLHKVKQGDYLLKRLVDNHVSICIADKFSKAFQFVKVHKW